MYTIIRKRHVFHALANLPSDVQGISKCLSNRKLGVAQTVNRVKTPRATSPTTERRSYSIEDTSSTITTTTAIPTATKSASIEEEDGSNIENKSDIEESMEGSHPAQPAEPGTLKASLLETPALASMTEKESAHPLQAPLCDFGPMNEHCDNTNIQDIQDVELTKLSLDENRTDEQIAPLKRTVNQVKRIYYFFFDRIACLLNFEMNLMFVVVFFFILFK